MDKFEILTKDELLETIYDGEPIANFPDIRLDKNIYKKQIELTGWHHKYNLKNHTEQRQKLIELLGKPTFTGKNLEDMEFYHKQTIWGFSYHDNPFFIYYNKDGLSIEITEECKDDVQEILDILIQTLSK